MDNQENEDGPVTITAMFFDGSEESAIAIKNWMDKKCESHLKYYSGPRSISYADNSGSPAARCFSSPGCWVVEDLEGRFFTVPADAILDAAQTYNAEIFQGDKSLNWDELKESLEKCGAIRQTSLVAEMPLFPPVRIMDGISNGIHPIPNLLKIGKNK